MKLLLLALTLFLLPLTARADIGNSTLTTGSLKGMRQVMLTVDKPSPALIAAGLTQESLTAAITVKLKAAGIHPMTAAEFADADAPPILNVEVVAMPRDSGFIVAEVVQVIQISIVSPAGKSPLVAPGVTWDNATTLGYSSADGIRDATLRDVDAFIAAWRSVNLAENAAIPPK